MRAYGHDLTAGKVQVIQAIGAAIPVINWLLPPSMKVTSTLWLEQSGSESRSMVICCGGAEPWYGTKEQIRTKLTADG